MSKVTVSLGITKNLGNFENVRLDIQVEDETRIIEGKMETAGAAIDRVYKLVEKKIDEKLAEATGETKE